MTVKAYPPLKPLVKYYGTNLANSRIFVLCHLVILSPGKRVGSGYGRFIGWLVNTRKKD